jgi:hypothetical protein
MHQDFRRPAGGGQWGQILFTVSLYNAGEFYTAVSRINVAFCGQSLLSFYVFMCVHKIVKSDY